MQYLLCKGIQYRQLDQQFLVYSSLSRETLLVHPSAFDIIQYLGSHMHPQAFENICESFDDVQDNSSREMQDFINITLEQFIGLGVIEYIT